MSAKSRCGFLVCMFTVLAAIPVAMAHPDDPKILDRLPRYEGPGYRAMERGAPPEIFPASGVRLLSWLPLGDFGSHSSGNDCWGYVSPSGREYAIMGLYQGIGFVEITDPGNAQIVTTIAAVGSLWHDVKVYQTYAYAVSEGGNGIQVIDMSDIDNGNVSHVGYITSGGTSASHNVAINEDSGYLYRCGGSENGLRFYDLNASPTNPPYVGQWITKYVHDAQIVSYTTGPFAGREIAFCCSGFNGGFTNTGLDIVDVTNKAAPFVVQNLQYPSPAYSHQAWLSADRTYLYLNDELDEGDFALPTTTHVINVSDIENPFYATSFTNGSTAIGHNVYTHQGLLFEANYTSGLRIFDLANPTSPAEVAYFDTRPEGNGTSFNGAWSVYPYFPSGTIIVSDIERGLFVLNLDVLTFDYPNGQPDLLDVGQAETITVDVEALAGIASPVDPNNVYLHYSVNGEPENVISMADQGSGIFEADLPGSDCFDSITWYVRAISQSGQTSYDPAFAPSDTYSAQVGDRNFVFSDAFETSTGWTVGSGGDNASTGVWVRVNPNGTAAQPEDDHSDPGTICYVTGNASPGGSIGDNDVDGGTTSLVSPTIDATGKNDVMISYWRWYSNSAGSAPNEDTFVIQVSNNNGASWTTVETIGPGGLGTGGGWYFNEFVVSDYVAPTAQVRMRFQASDLFNGSIVEAAIDDFNVTFLSCEPLNAIVGDFDQDGDVDLSDFAVFSVCFGGANNPPPVSCPGSIDADFDDDGDVDLGDFAILSLNFTGPL